MGPLVNKRVLLGVTGSVAAYKAAELVRRLREAGAEVQVVMTRASTEFITPLTLQAVSGRPVRQHLLDPASEAAMDHIQLARWADMVVVAPASAHFLAKLAHGLADDLLSTVCLATEAQVVVAPAMNLVMWGHAATRENCRVLEGRGVVFAGPTAGAQACGEEGLGRLLEPEAIVARLETLCATSPRLAGRTVLVTAGPTRESLDPVRYLGNRSSGKMGYAIATAAAAAGARVILVSGPVTLPTPRGVERVDVENAQQMLEAVMSRVQGCDIFVAAAAVADYRPTVTADRKLKKETATLSLTLERTPDILAAVAAYKPAPFCVGFAAETEQLEAHAEAKLKAKHLDMVAANWVGRPGVGFEAEENELTVLWPGGRQVLACAPKEALAHALVTLIATRYDEKNQA